MKQHLSNIQSCTKAATFKAIDPTIKFNKKTTQMLSSLIWTPTKCKSKFEFQANYKINVKVKQARYLRT